MKRLLTLLVAVTACTSLPKVEPAPVGDAGLPDAAVDACMESLVPRLPRGSVAGRGDVIGTALAAVEVASTTGSEPAIAWVGKCPAFDKAAIYLTKQSALAGGDLCASAERFADSSFDAESEIKPVRLIPNARLPAFICAVSATSIGILPEPSARVTCFGKGPAFEMRLLTEEYLLAAFRSNPLLPSAIRLVYATAGGVMTRLIDAPNSDLVASGPVKVRDLRTGESTSTSAFSPDLLTDEATNGFDGFLEVIQTDAANVKFRRYAADGTLFGDNTPFALTTNGAPAPKMLTFGEAGTVPTASVLGFEGGSASRRSAVVILNPRGQNAAKQAQTLTYAVDLTSQAQLAALNADSGYLEKFAFAPSVDLTAGAGLVAVRGVEIGGKEVSAIAKLGSPQLATATADNAAFVPERIAKLPLAYGMALGTSGLGASAAASGYLAIRTSDVAAWAPSCTRGVIAAFPISLK